MTEQNESPGSVSRKDVEESTREITERVDERSGEVRADLADRSEAIISQVATAADESQVKNEHKVETVRSALADRTEQARVELENEMLSRREQIDSKLKNYRNTFLVAVAIMLVANTALYYLYLNPRAGRPQIELSEIRVSGSTDLCPGNSLYFEFDVVVKTPGVYALDMSTWKVTPPPAAVLFSEADTFIIGNKRSFPIARRWRVPLMYVDPATNEMVSWVPGEYIRDIGFTAVGQNTRASLLALPFTIKPDCNER